MEGSKPKFPPPNNRNLGWPLGQNGGEVRAGWADSGEICNHSVHAPLEPRASLVVRASLFHNVSQDGCSGLSEKAILGIFWPSKMRVLPH